MTIRLTLASHSVSLSSVQLGHSLSSRPHSSIGHTVVETIASAHWRLDFSHLLAQALVLTQNVHAAQCAGSLLGAGFQCACVVAQGRHVVFHSAECLLDVFTWHHRLVLQRFTVTSILHHNLVLITNPLGFFPNFFCILVLHIRVGVVETFGFQTFFLFFQSSQLGRNVGVQKVVDVFAVQHFWHDIVFPLVIFQHVELFEIDIEHTGSAVFALNVTGQNSSVWIFWVVLGQCFSSFRNESRSLCFVTLSWSGNMNFVQHIGDTGRALQFSLNTGSQQLLTRSVTHLHHVLLLITGSMHDINAGRVRNGFQKGSFVFVQVLDLDDITLVHDNHDRLVGKQWFDGMEQLDSSLDGKATSLGQIHEVQHTRAQMGNGVDGSHFNVVHFLGWSVQDSRGVDCSETQVLVVKMTHVQGFGGESVRSDLDVGLGNAAQEGRFSHVRVAADKQRSCVGVDGRQTAQVSSHSFQVDQGVLQFLCDGGHSTQSGSFQSLTSVQRSAELQQTHVVSGHLLDQSFRLGHSSQRHFVVVFLIQRVHQVSVERMHVVDVGEPRQHVCELLSKTFSGKLDFSHVKRPDTGDFEPGSDDRRGFSSGSIEHDIQHIVGRGHGGNVFPRKLHWRRKVLRK
ncbi:conserved hypothetical protein [Clavispora lusitaniae ATCC 42720]|uniref:Uncharacterized protein n=1 Tax=Clavispora lusitaniae (strain ATCC 42720) TaxID=306902 RepID=C4Y1E2_CLAL4|nr:uncharacterized protein CLUG_02024 [Clavispora lusitaniae ATCC 42720]EEQ37900.1 conserved hypothetical protein [Clavispora lusitaniae ATCC 42720]